MEPGKEPVYTLFRAPAVVLNSRSSQQRSRIKGVSLSGASRRSVQQRHSEHGDELLHQGVTSALGIDRAGGLRRATAARAWRPVDDRGRGQGGRRARRRQGVRPPLRRWRSDTRDFVASDRVELFPPNRRHERVGENRRHHGGEGHDGGGDALVDLNPQSREPARTRDQHAGSEQPLTHVYLPWCYAVSR